MRVISSDCLPLHAVWLLNYGVHARGVISQACMFIRVWTMDPQSHLAASDMSSCGPTDTCRHCSRLRTATSLQTADRYLRALQKAGHCIHAFDHFATCMHRTPLLTCTAKCRRQYGNMCRPQPTCMQSGHRQSGHLNACHTLQGR